MLIYKADASVGLEIAKNAILKHYGNIIGKTVELGRLSSGKPVVLYDGKEEGYVSVSHTENVVLIAFCDSEVGIDIENSNRQTPKKICADITEWTQKEAYSKYLGTGLTREILNNSVPYGLVDSFIMDEYTVSVASADKKVDIISLTSK